MAGLHMRICPPVATLTSRQRIGPFATWQSPPVGLVMLMINALPVALLARPNPLNDTSALLADILALGVPSDPVWDWMTAGQPTAEAAQPIVQLESTLAVPASSKVMMALRRTASARANCKPEEMDSAAVRICEFCTQTLKLGAPTLNRMARITTPIMSSIRVNPSWTDRAINTSPPLW